jgi:hypothetical protein
MTDYGSRTPFLKLLEYNTTTDGSALFWSFAQNLSGDISSSNMNKIDTSACGFNNLLIGYKEKSVIPLYGIKGADISGSVVYDATNLGISGYTTDMIVDLYLDTINDKPVLLDINTSGSKHLYKASDSASATDIINGELMANKHYLFRFSTEDDCWYIVGAIPLSQVTTSGSLYEIIVAANNSYGGLKQSGVLLTNIPSITGSYVVAALNPNLSNEWLITNGSGTFIRFQHSLSASTISVDISAYEPLFSGASSISLIYNNTLQVVSGSIALASIVSSEVYNSVDVDSYGRIVSGSLADIYIDSIECSGSPNEIIISSGSRLMKSGVLAVTPGASNDILISTGSAWISASSVNSIKFNTTGSGVDIPVDGVRLYTKANGYLYSKDIWGNEVGPITSDGNHVPQFDNSSITDNLIEWNKFRQTIASSTDSGKLFSTTIVSTFSLAYVGAYAGGVLDLEGNIHFIQRSNTNTIGQKISPQSIISTYSVPMIVTGNVGFIGGVLSPNGDIHFISNTTLSYPSVGKKISRLGVVSTYGLVITGGNGYWGGVLAPNGDIHFVPYQSGRGQKIDINGNVSTYSYPTGFATLRYSGGVLSPSGEIHFVPSGANWGLKIKTDTSIASYVLIYTTSNAYSGGVLAPNGDIHFVPYSAKVGQKIDINENVSTYTLVYSTSGAYRGGILAPNGDIHFVPYNARVGQKIDKNGLVSTYTLPYSVNAGYWGGVLSPNGDIYFIPYSATVGMRIHSLANKPFNTQTCISPYFNKL